MSAVTPGGGVSPPKAKEAVFDSPEPAKKSLTVFKSAVSVHAEPFQDSVSPVAPGESSPPNDKADVEVPVPALSLTPVFKSPTSVQLTPLYVSVVALTGSPPNANPATLVPDPAPLNLVVFKAPLVRHAPAEVTFGYLY